MTTKGNIKAIWVESHDYIPGDEHPMCSASERDEIFHYDNSSWKYNLPAGYKLFKTPPKIGDYVEIVGEQDGKNITVGYACPVVYVLMATVFKTWEECYNSKYFHPSDYVQCRIQDAAKFVAQQKELLEEGGYGD